MLCVVESPRRQNLVCAGRWAYNKTLWPPAHDVWRQRLTEAPKHGESCPVSLNDIQFTPHDKEAERRVKKAATEDADAGTEKAHGGKRRPIPPMADMHYSWGPEVHIYITKDICAAASLDYAACKLTRRLTRQHGHMSN